MVNKPDEKGHSDAGLPVVDGEYALDPSVYPNRSRINQTIRRAIAAGDLDTASGLTGLLKRSDAQSDSQAPPELNLDAPSVSETLESAVSSQQIPKAPVNRLQEHPEFDRYVSAVNSSVAYHNVIAYKGGRELALAVVAHTKTLEDFLGHGKKYLELPSVEREHPRAQMDSLLRINLSQNFPTYFDSREDKSNRAPDVAERKKYAVDITKKHLTLEALHELFLMQYAAVRKELDDYRARKAEAANAKKDV